MKKMYPTAKWSINAPKIFLLCAMVFTIALTTISCSKDDSDPKATVYPEENFLEGYLATTGYSQIHNALTNDIVYETGVVFSPNVTGKIKALTVKLPAVNASLRVTIWDATTQTVLKTETVNVSSAYITITKSISELALEKDKKYAITMNTGNYFNSRRTDYTAPSYPVISGNITIWGARMKSGTTQTFPNMGMGNFYYGDLSFVFQQTN